MKGFDDWGEKARDLILLIPALHVFCCFFYLFFYYQSFGNGLIFLASPTEVFSVSLSELAPLYISLGAGLLLGLFTFGTDPTQDQNRSQSGKEKPKHWFMSSLGVFAAFSMLVAILGAVASVSSGYIFWYVFAIPAALVISFLIGYFGAKRGNSYSEVLVAIIASTVLIAIAYNGLSDGQHYAKVKLSLSDRGFVTCGDVRILKDVGDNFLAVDEDHSRIIISSACEKLFEVIPGEEVSFDKPPVIAEVLADLSGF